MNRSCPSRDGYTITRHPTVEEMTNTTGGVKRGCLRNAAFLALLRLDGGNRKRGMVNAFHVLSPDVTEHFNTDDEEGGQEAQPDA